MAKSGKTKGAALEVALERGEKFFQKGNFPLAKREIETALGLGVSEALARELGEKLAVCAREIAILEAREAIKRARKLEKKGQLREALAQFEKALAIERETWIEERVAALRLKLSQAEASDLLATVAPEDDPRVRLAAYDKALAAGADAAVSEQRANCLVELERFDAAIAAYATAPPSCDASRYRLGYSHAAVGRTLDALAAWRDIETLPQGLAAQVEQLLPFACREADGAHGDGRSANDAAEDGAQFSQDGGDRPPHSDQHRPPVSMKTSADGHGIVIAMAERVDPREKSANFNAWEAHARCRRLEALWQQKRFDEMPPLLPPLGQPPQRSALALHAKVGFKRAERDPERLESAIALWLTAVYDDNMLDTLAVHQVGPPPPDRQAMRERLVQRLGTLIQDHAKEGRLSPRIQGIWRLEERVIRQLARLPARGEPPAGYPCTPGFARRHGLADAIFAFLDAQPSVQSEHGGAEPGIDLLEARACFGPTGEAMMRMEAGEEEQALAAMPRGLDNDLGRYCRARIALACGIAKARRGEARIKQHYLDALPLLRTEPERLQEILDLAYADKPASFFEGLADALEALSGQIDHADLPETTAHVMGIRAVALLNRGTNHDAVRKLLERALAIFPESELAGSTLNQLEEHRIGDEMQKAFKRLKPLRAARLARTTSDPHNRDFFFDTIEHWYRSALDMQPSARTRLLAEIHQSCRIVDEGHPLVGKIESAMTEPSNP